MLQEIHRGKLKGKFMLKFIFLCFMFSLIITLGAV